MNSETTLNELFYGAIQENDLRSVDGIMQLCPDAMSYVDGGLMLRAAAQFGTASMVQYLIEASGTPPLICSLLCWLYVGSPSV